MSIFLSQDCFGYSGSFLSLNKIFFCSSSVKNATVIWKGLQHIRTILGSRIVILHYWFFQSKDMVYLSICLCHLWFLSSSKCFSGTLCFFNFISGSSAFSKSSLNFWKFMVHILLKPGLENFEHYFPSVWDECNCAIVQDVSWVQLCECHWQENVGSHQEKEYL